MWSLLGFGWVTALMEAQRSETATLLLVSNELSSYMSTYKLRSLDEIRSIQNVMNAVSPHQPVFPHKVYQYLRILHPLIDAAASGRRLPLWCSSYRTHCFLCRQCNHFFSLHFRSCSSKMCVCVCVCFVSFEAPGGRHLQSLITVFSFTRAVIKLCEVSSPLTQLVLSVVISFAFETERHNSCTDTPLCWIQQHCFWTRSPCSTWGIHLKSKGVLRILN